MHSSHLTEGLDEDFGLEELEEVGGCCLGFELEGFSVDSIFSLNFLTSSANCSYLESVLSGFTSVDTEGVCVSVGTEVGLFRIVLPKPDFSLGECG